MTGVQTCALPICHSLAGSNNIYQGSAAYGASIHGTDANVYWPGPSPPSKSPSDYGKCVNCHTPHGYDDGSGLVPSQAFAREENLCESCHDGSPSTIDIQFEMNKTYRHPTSSYSTRHDPSESGPGAFDNLNRHAECVDCHNPHYADSDSIPPVAPDASNRIRGVSGVSVINGSAGTVPGYSYIPSATGISYEYELCFKCHSSWTTQPGGQPDLSVLFNPNNTSYHPVEAQAQNLGIDPNSFVNGWNTGNTMHCSDCHTSDNNQVRGPHGSQYDYILKKDYAASSSKRTMNSNEICFDCHKYNTYANDNADTEQRYSRFYKKGHGFHVDKKQYPCYACHDSHGAANRPNLIVTGRNPGIDTFSQAGPGTGDKGSCNPTCHGNKDYNIQYAR